MDDSFENDLQNYYKARASATSAAKPTDQTQEHSSSEIEATSYLHPAGFIPLPDQPNFSHDPNTQMWYDASTQVYSYYDAASGSYIPIPPSQPEETGQDFHHFDNDTQQELYQHQQYEYLEAPPESDATLRLRVLSSDILPVGGIVSMDASGLSFGRDRPLAGQGKRLRLAEMDISRFHASIFLNREWIYPTTAAATESEQEAETNQEEHDDLREQATKNDLSNNGEVKECEDSCVEPEKKTDQQQQHADLESQSDGGVAEEKAESEAGEESEENATNKDTVSGDDSKEQEEGELDDESEDEAVTLSDTKDQKQSDLHEEGATDSSALHLQYYADYYAYHQQQQYYEQPPASSYEDTFQIFDCGSTHGTFLNGERLSPPKAASKPFTLKHLDQLKLGSTTFEVHAHNEGRVCADCQARDDNEIEVLDDKERTPVNTKPVNNVDLRQNKLSMEQQRIEEMNRLKKKWATTRSSSKQQHYGNKHGSPSSVSTVSSEGNNSGGSGGGYVDRAAKRRLLNPDRSSQPSSRPIPQHEDTSESPQVASGFHIPVGVQNKGYAMLSKMGWKEGTGLGLEQHGVVEPVQLKVAQQRMGLGSSALLTQGAAAEQQQQQQQARKETIGEIARRQARQRFAQLQ
ncbi:Angiogenic factor with G patch and FHA domains 1 [Actinomortierella wolfii]|nr:Angiogenic factor with G patch and FHA domains 1 [Actinomortierella wolfii]